MVADQNNNIAVILCGGLSTSKTLSDATKQRCDYFLANEAAFGDVIISSRYTLNKPQFRDSAGFVCYEAAVAARYIKEHSRPRNIYLELSSSDTIGSALFVLQYLVNLGKTDLSVSIITSQWHMFRAKCIFLWASGLSDLFSSYALHFCPVDSAMTNERVKHEEKQLKRFQSEWEGIDTIEKAWQKLFLHHDNYSIRAASADCNETTNLLY